MHTATKLGAFALGLGVVFVAAYGAGQVADPGTAAGDRPDSAAAAHQSTEVGPSEATQVPGGLQVSERGYTFVPVGAPEGEFAFRITGPDGQPITDFDVAHDQRMHLIAVRRDLSGYSHVHPEMDPDGTWRVASPVGEAGTWRVFADFIPSGDEGLTLGSDVHAAGTFTPQPLPEPTQSVIVDGYLVTLNGTLEPGRTSRLTLTVERDGVPVTDLEPYLGAYGHLVALRSGDLAYLHVHPDGTPGDGTTRPGPEVTFYAEVPSGGAYRLFLDFRHDGEIRTAAITAIAGGTAADPPTAGPSAPPDEHTHE